MAVAPMTVARPARAAMLEPAVEATFDETLARHGAEIYRFALHLTRTQGVSGLGPAALRC